jgi:thiol-disulfide isomerase/thioredoxin
VKRVASVSLAVAFFLAACGGVGEKTGGGGSGTGSLLPADRMALPEYGVAQFEELLAELRGRPVVVNFWGSWCPPCREEAPDLRTASEEFEGRVQFLGVDILDNREAAREFIREFDWRYPSVFDPEAEIRGGLGYLGQPITLIYDARGRLAFDTVGIVTLELLREEIRKVL